MNRFLLFFTSRPSPVSICLYNESAPDPPSRPLTPIPAVGTGEAGTEAAAASSLGGGDSPVAQSSLNGSIGTGAVSAHGRFGGGAFLGRHSTGRSSGERPPSSRAAAVGTRVAVKALQPHCSAEAALMLQAEARLLASLSHPNIVGFVGQGVWSSACGRPFVVQECVDGGTLQDRIVHRMTHRARSSYSFYAALAWGGDIAAGLAYLHTRAPPVVHRDLKPENVLLTREAPAGAAHPRAVLADFGLARALTAPGVGDAGAPAAGGMAGTGLSAKARVRGLAPTACTGSFIYMAPEVLQGEAYGVPADVFSLGIVLQELVSGVLTSAVVVGPTFNPRAGEVYARKVAGGFRRALPAGLPPALAALIEACWSAAPAARPSAAAVHASLVAIAVDAAAGTKGGGGANDVAGAFTPGGGLKKRPSAARLDRLGSRSSAGGEGSGGKGGAAAAPAAAGAPATPGCMGCSIM